jgi:two-component system response regulator YesN
MFKVLIIDDEQLVRMGLKSMLPWEKLGYEIVGEALNGQQGLDLIGKLQPDIVITDIKMPVMDGLELMRRATAAQPQLKFIILSSYDDFELVKQAMKQGAEEYLIKLSLEAESLGATLASVREKIIAERGKPMSDGQLDKGLRENITMLREGFLKRLINKPLPSRAELDQQLKYLGIELETTVCCALIRISDPGALEKYEAHEVHSLETAILNTIDEIVNDVFKGYTLPWNPGEFLVICSDNSNCPAETFLAQAVSMGERVAQMVKQYFNISVSVGFGNPFHDYTMLKEGYFEGLRAIRYCHYSGTPAIMCFSQLPPGNENQAQIDISAQKSILPQAIELHDLETIGSVFETLSAIVSDPCVSREQAYDLCFQIAYLIPGALGVSEAELKEVFGYKNSLYESILSLNTLAEIHAWFIGLERNIFRRLSRNDAQKNHRLIARAKKYILDHYAGEISLNEVAAAINISSGYLSTIFRQETGICFTDYVTEIKIGQAKKLLRESEYKVYEISEMLGYQNAYYFSKVFKKITGMTPSEYSGKQS